MKTRRRFNYLPLALGTSVLVGAPLGCSDDAPSGNSGGLSGVAGSSSSAGGGSESGSSGDSSGAGAASGGSAGADGGSAGSAGMAGAAGGGSAGCLASKTDAEQATLLSQTGCINMAEPTKPAPGLIPYAVNSRLWSDAATKERFVRVPDDTKIHVLDCATEVDACKPPGLGGVGSDDGHWDMPVGTVLVKNFSIEGKHIETRLLMRRSMTVWKGFSYEWNDGQTEATLLPDDETGKDKPVGSTNQVWHYPSRAQCMECHTPYSGRSLGPTTAQLNSDFDYADGAMNQIEKFQQLGLFDAPPKDIAPYPGTEPADAGTTEQKALSYLQTNCSICHRPGAEGSQLDLRFATPFADRGLCEPSERDTGVVPAYRLVPGDPLNSNLSFRMHALDEVRMPKIGSSVVDATGTTLIDAWITALPTDACPPQP